MPRLRGIISSGTKKEPKDHELTVIKVKSVAHELGYNIIGAQISPGAGIDLQIKNPKNNRIAIVEIERSYASQTLAREKLGRYWNEIKKRVKNGEDVILLVFGVTRNLLLKDLARPPANVPDACAEYGKRVFSSPYVEETSHIQTALLRCLGDE